MAIDVPFREVVAFAVGGGWGFEHPVAGTVRVSVIRGTDFANLNNLDFHEIPRRYESVPKVAKRTLRPGDVLLEISGGSPTSGQSTGRSFFVRQVTLSGLEHPVIPASFCRLVRFDQEKVDPRFGFYALQEMYRSGRAAAYEHRSTGLSNFQFEYFLDQERIRLVPLAEQRVISGILGALDDKIELNRRMNRTLEAMARALFKSWFVDFDAVRAKTEGRDPGLPPVVADLFPNDFEDSEVGEIPAGWRVGKLGDLLAELISGARPKGGAVAAGVPSIGAENVRGLGQYDFSKEKFIPAPFFGELKRKGAAVRPGDVLLYKDGAQVGRKTYFDQGFPHEECAINEHVFILRASHPDAQRYLFFWLDQDWMTNEIVALNSNSAQPGINQPGVRSLPILKPPTSVITAFDRLVRPLTDRLFANCLESQNLARARDALLPRLISGQIQAPHAEQAVEAALV